MTPTLLSTPGLLSLPDCSSSCIPSCTAAVHACVHGLLAPAMLTTVDSRNTGDLGLGTAWGGALSEYGHYIVQPISIARSSLCAPSLPLGKPVIASSLTGADDGKWIRTGALSSKHMHSFRWHRLVRRSQDRGPGNGKEGSVH